MLLSRNSPCIQTTDNTLSEIEQEDDATSTSVASIDGVVFSQEHNCWVPDPKLVGMTHKALPPSAPEEASYWIFKRSTTAEFIKSRVEVYGEGFPEKNMIMGEPCYPKQVGNCSCGVPWSSAPISLVCWFTLRTSVGAVARRRYAAKCSCQELLHWDPSTEFIHAISFQEGGEFGNKTNFLQFQNDFKNSFLSFSGGWELAYDYFTHITGEKGKFSGVPMHVGHYRDSMESRIQMNNPGVAGFFSARKWRIFIHSALALRMASLSPRTREPCCDLRVVGGDGTGIGIPLKNVRITPAWVPPEPALSSEPRGSIVERCAIGPTDTKGDASDINKARQFLNDMTSRATTVSHRGDMRGHIDDYIDFMPSPVFHALERFLILEQSEPHWHDIRCLLSTLSHKESLTGVISVHIINDMKLLIKKMRFEPTANDVPESALLDRISKYGMGPEIVRIFRAEMAASLKLTPPRPSSTCMAMANLFEYIGNFLTTAIESINTIRHDYYILTQPYAFPPCSPTYLMMDYYQSRGGFPDQIPRHQESDI